MSPKAEFNTIVAVSTADQGNLAELGKALVNQFYVTYKTAQIYEQNNLTFLKQSQNLARVVEKILDNYQLLYLQLKNGYIFLNDVRLKFDFAGYIGNKFWIEELQRTRIGAINFLPGVTQRELDKFIYLLIRMEGQPERTFDIIKQRLADIGAGHISIEELPEEEHKANPDQEHDNRLIAKRTFFKAISVVKEVMNNAREQKHVNLARAKRVVQSLVDQIIKDDKLFLELSTIKNFDEYTFVHSANVAVLCIILGLRLGLDRKELAELGFAALFHDIGKVKLPIDLINKPGEFDEFDWEQMRKHPVMGVKALITARNLDDFTTRSVVVCFEHHLTLDLNGYPKVKEKRILNLHTRILQISDAYNAMTSGRVYIKTAVPPYEVLRKMWHTAGKSFDAHIMKLFTNIMGVYPVGSLVLLDTDEIAVVYQPNPDNIYRPKVKIIADRSGKKHAPIPCDLSETPAGGTFSKSIVRVLDAEKYGIDAGSYVVDY
jgi:HD-GYP domain-containing protein (c-di-GMP phosphodiesterase class II)